MSEPSPPSPRSARTALAVRAGRLAGRVSRRAGMGAGVTIGGRVALAVAPGVIGELAVRNLPLLWLNAVLLFGSFAAIGLAASVSFDRLPPALGVTIAIVVVMYFFDVLGSLWPKAEGALDRYRPSPVVQLSWKRTLW